MHEYETLFAAAWDDPRHTAARFPDMDVNAVLDARYDTPVRLTRTQLWDMEVRKARRPDLFIPAVLRPETVRSWGDDPTYTRVSEQRYPLDPERYGTVIERVHVNDERQAVTFLGTAEATDADGRALTSRPGEPLFHVEHAVGGSEDRPLNTMRWIVLTDAPDERHAKRLAEVGAPEYLWEFVERYITGVLGAPLRRRDLPARVADGA